MEKRVLLTELVDRGSHLRKEITPTATITDDGKYTAGTFWDANKTLNEIVHGATEAQDTLKEVEDKLNNEIATARNAEQALSDRMDDILGIDALDIADLKGIVEDLDPETGILSVIDSKANKEEVDLLKDDISIEAQIEDANGHDYVEIAGIKWATMNVGAQSVTDGGLYFAWGETTGYTAEQVGVDKNFSASDYELFTDTLDVIKYNNLDGKVILELTDDAAAVNMGGSWRMPTTEEWQALGQAVNTEWTNNYNDTGVSGLICTDKTDSSKVLFFPLPGTCLDGGKYYPGDDGSYWSSNINNGSVNYAKNSKFFAVFEQKTWGTNYNLRYSGFSVRGVLGITTSKVLGTTITDSERTKWNTVDNKADSSVLTDYVQKSQTEGLLKNDGTVDTNTYLTQHQDISGKANIRDISVVSGLDPNGHDYVDLGLPSGTVWATTNVGATNVEDFGTYYMYGKTTAYNSSDSKYTGTENPLSLSNDAARVSWGGDWHLPTSSQITELINNTDFEWVTINNVPGGKFINKSDSSKYIFLPAGGYKQSGSTSQSGTLGYYQGSSPNSAYGSTTLMFNSGQGYDAYTARTNGCLARPVLNSAPIFTLGKTATDAEKTLWNTVSSKANTADLGTAATKNVPTTGNASTTEVVMGNDSRLTDARNAADVSAWAKASTKPTYAYSEITGTPDLSLKANVADISVAVDNTNGHAYVDLGLPSGTLWATMNVGASSEEDYGNYYMYGKTTTYNSSDSIYTGTEDSLSSSADAAHVNWGGGWHMPTRNQIVELIDNTTYQWVTNHNGSGINGGKFTAQNGNYVFFPAAGFWYHGGPGGEGNYGYYWSSSPDGSGKAYYSLFGSNYKFVDNDSPEYGDSVRPVLDSAPTTSILGKTATDAEKAAWNAKSNFSGSYDDLTNKPNVVTSTTTGLKIEVVASMPASPDANTIYIVQ